MVKIIFAFWLAFLGFSASAVTPTITLPQQSVAPMSVYWTAPVTASGISGVVSTPQDLLDGHLLEVSLVDSNQAVVTEIELPVSPIKDFPFKREFLLDTSTFILSGEYSVVVVLKDINNKLIARGRKNYSYKTAVVQPQLLDLSIRGDELRTTYQNDNQNRTLSLIVEWVKSGEDVVSHREILPSKTFQRQEKKSLFETIVPPEIPGIYILRVYMEDDSQRRVTAVQKAKSSVNGAFAVIKDFSYSPDGVWSSGQMVQIGVDIFLRDTGEPVEVFTTLVGMQNDVIVGEQKYEKVYKDFGTKIGHRLEYLPLSETEQIQVEVVVVRGGIVLARSDLQTRRFILEEDTVVEEDTKEEVTTGETKDVIITTEAPAENASSWLLILFLIVLFTLVIGGACFFVFKRKKNIRNKTRVLAFIFTSSSFVAGFGYIVDASSIRLPVGMGTTKIQTFTIGDNPEDEWIHSFTLWNVNPVNPSDVTLNRVYIEGMLENILDPSAPVSEFLADYEPYKVRVMMGDTGGELYENPDVTIQLKHLDLEQNAYQSYLDFSGIQDSINGVKNISIDVFFASVNTPEECLENDFTGICQLYTSFIISTGRIDNAFIIDTQGPNFTSVYPDFDPDFSMDASGITTPNNYANESVLQRLDCTDTDTDCLRLWYENMIEDGIELGTFTLCDTANNCTSKDFPLMFVDTSGPETSTLEIDNIAVTHNGSGDSTQNVFTMGSEYYFEIDISDESENNNSDQYQFCSSDDMAYNEQNDACEQLLRTCVTDSSPPQFGTYNPKIETPSQCNTSLCPDGFTFVDDGVNEPYCDPE